MRTTKWQMARFSIVFMGSQTTMFMIPDLIESSSYQGWYGLLIGGCLALITLFFTIQVGKLNPDAGWVDFGAEIIGKWVHRAMVIVLLCWCIYYTAFDIENFVMFFGANYLRNTPHLFIQILTGLVIMYTAHLGLASIIYMSEGIALVFIFSTILSIYLFIQNANSSMLPAFIHYHDAHTIFRDSITGISWFGEWVVFLFIAPELKFSNQMMKRLSVASILLLAIVLLGWLMTMLNFGPHLGKELWYPYLELIRSHSNDDLLGNTDPLLIGIWSASMFIHSSFMIYAAYKCTLYLTKQKMKNFLIPILTGCSITIAYLYSENLEMFTTVYYSFNTVLLWIAVELIPMYYFIVAMLRMKLGKKLK